MTSNRTVELLKEYRCKKCKKLLGKFKGQAEIVCPKCKTINEIKE